MGQPAETRDAILVVDDDQDLQRMLRTALEDKGFRVEVVGDGLAAVDFLKTGRKTDLVILDLFLPTLDGWAVLAQMQRLPHRPPVVVLSGTAEVNITPRIFREGVEAFVAKPFQLAVLIHTVQALIARAKGEPPVPDRRQPGERRTMTLPVTVVDADDQPRQEGRLLNLSVHGALLELPGALPPGQSVRLLYAPGSGSPLTLEGSVQWWRHPGATEATSHGIAFTGLSAEQQRRIKEIAVLD